MSKFFEKKILNENGKALNIAIPYNEHVGIMLSGGADSALLLYLLAKITLEENLGTKIFPVTAELLRRPFNIRYADGVIAKVTELTGYDFDFHLTFPLPNHRLDLTDAEKTEVMNKYSREFARRFQFVMFYDGITANPPTTSFEVTENSIRPKDRDDPNERQKRQQINALSVPFCDLDKRDLALFYKKFGLLESLFPITRSCEGEAHEAGQFFNKTCFDARPAGEECFWCLEREYGFGELTNNTPPSETAQKGLIDSQQNLNGR